MPLQDIFPQWLNLTPITESAANTYTQSETKVNPPSGQHVMEILAVETEQAKPDVAAGATGSRATRMQITTRTKSALTTLEDPDVIWKQVRRTETVYAEATETGGGPTALPLEVDLRDYSTSGKGFLVASQSIFLAGHGSGQGAVGVYRGRILHKWVKVTSAELVQLTRQ